MSEENTNPENWTFEPKENIQPAKTEKKRGNVVNYIVIAAVFLMVGFLLSSMTGITGQFIGTSKMSADRVSEKIVNFLKENPSLEESEISIESIEENNGVYELMLNVDGQGYPSFASFDGRFLFPNGIDMDFEEETLIEPAQQEPQTFPKTDKPAVDLYVMSFCPYGTQAETAMLPVADLLGDSASINIKYILSNDGNGGVRSLHGDYESEEDGRQLCIVNEYSTAKLWEYLEVFNGICSKNNLDTCWKEKAEEVGIDTEKIETCFDGKGLDLLKIQADLSEVNGITGSPTLLINGVRYSGSRTPEGYKNAICSAFTDPPEECSEVLEGETVQASGQC
ncbi:MAG: hypothetical protein V1693_01270 [Nanoarchaeota archaeon]